MKCALREKCPYSELFWALFSRIGTEYGKIRSITRMQENTDQNNCECGHFLCSRDSAFPCHPWLLKASTEETKFLNNFILIRNQLVGKKLNLAFTTNLYIFIVLYCIFFIIDIPVNKNEFKHFLLIFCKIKKLPWMDKSLALFRRLFMQWFY